MAHKVISKAKILWLQRMRNLLSFLSSRHTHRT